MSTGNMGTLWDIGVRAGQRAFDCGSYAVVFPGLVPRCTDTGVLMFPGVSGNMPVEGPTEGHGTMATDQGRLTARLAVEAALARRGWNRAQLADTAGSDAGTVGDFLDGKRWPKIATQGRIERALGWASGTITGIANGARDAPEEDMPPPEARPARSSLSPEAIELGSKFAAVVVFTETCRQAVPSLAQEAHGVMRDASQLYGAVLEHLEQGRLRVPDPVRYAAPEDRSALAEAARKLRDIDDDTDDTDDTDESVESADRRHHA